MLHILRRCPSRGVRHLEVEFEEDESEHELFFYIPQAFPQLQYVVIHRYRCPVGGADVTPVATLAKALAPLRDLRILLCNLDFVEAPDPFSDDFSPFVNDTLQDAADVLARSLSRTVEVIGFLLRRDILAHYLYFRPVRDGRSGPDAQRDRFACKTSGLPMGDMTSLCRP
uniref:N/A n=1 Tax=Ganoderma boninense TaxID=34458 RepID=A0A5K1K5Q2_9APHY|nr:N/A [Ganoderma boninense]